MIWKQTVTPELVNERGKGSYSELLGITCIEVGDDYMCAHMAVTKRHLQPAGIMHGGVSCSVAETVGSAAAQYCVSEEKYCVGLDINTNHLKVAREGDILLAKASPHHLGQSTQVWEIVITSAGKLISVNRLTLLVR